LMLFAAGKINDFCVWLSIIMLALFGSRPVRSYENLSMSSLLSSLTKSKPYVYEEHKVPTVSCRFPLLSFIILSQLHCYEGQYGNLIP
jgi:hypothetical protein